MAVGAELGTGKAISLMEMKPWLPSISTLTDVLVFPKMGVEDEVSHLALSGLRSCFRLTTFLLILHGFRFHFFKKNPGFRPLSHPLPFSLCFYMERHHRLILKTLWNQTPQPGFA